MNRLVVRLAVSLAMLIAVAAMAGNAFAAGTVVISEVYGGGGNAGATYKNDFIELFNPGASAVDLSGWSVQYGSATGTTAWTGHTALSGSIAAGGYYLIKESAGTGGTVDLPTPDATGTIAMAATAGKVALISSAAVPSGACPAAGIPVIDLVGYGTTANCAEGAPAPTLSNTTSDSRNAAGTDTDHNSVDFTAGDPTPTGSGGGSGPPVGTELKIDEIQGAGHQSPYKGQAVITHGIVTAIRSTGTVRGFFLQDPAPDANPATSEGIFVFVGASWVPNVAPGDAVDVAGSVSEFASAGDLTETEIVAPTFTVTSHGNAVPLPFVLSQSSSTPPPTSVIEDDAFVTFDPASDGMDFDESLEGMLVELDDLQAVGPTNSFGELWVLPNNGAGASVLTPRGGIVVRPNDFNPEKFLVDDAVFGTTGHFMPSVNVGATMAGSHLGVMDYAFSNYVVHLLAEPAVTANPLQRETTSIVGTPTKLTTATFNVENLAPSDGPDKFARLAGVLVDRLQSPDIVALEEVQDNDGATDDGVVDSSVTLAALSDAVVSAGGPRYAYRWIDPVNDQDGGQPGGNIRVAYFFRTDVPELSFVDRPGGGSTTDDAVVGGGDDTHLLYSPGRVDPGSDAWSSSRKPLAAEFLFNGQRLFVIANHFASKLGDDALWGSTQPPVQSSETQRHKQAHEVADFVSQITAADPSANVLVLGDLNDFQFSEPLQILEAAGLHALIDTLPENERYTYVFDGNSQAIDHILVGGGLWSYDRAYDVVHVNSEFADQSSDHDPQIASFDLPVSVESVCGLISAWAKNAGEANSLCVKLQQGQIDAFDHELDAQAGKAFTAEQVTTLKALAAGI